MMTLKLFTLILASVSLSAIAQIILRFGMTGERVKYVLNSTDESGLNTIFTILTNPYIISGLLLYAFGAVMWLFVLGKLEVSMAYPYVGLGFILTMIFGWGLLGESISLVRMCGTLLIALGVVLISYS